jgi:uncharacterized membrane protein YidH (DUF202 family)
MRKLLYFVTLLGVAASAVGFGAAYWAIHRFEPRTYHYVLTSLGLFAAGYGFSQAFRTIRIRRVEVGNARLALALTSAGLASTVYGFVQAYRGTLLVSCGPGRALGLALVTVGLAGALYGFWRAYRVILEEWRRQSARG